MKNLIFFITTSVAGVWAETNDLMISSICLFGFSAASLLGILTSEDKRRSRLN